jgi:hypothetical protein
MNGVTYLMAFDESISNLFTKVGINHGLEGRMLVSSLENRGSNLGGVKNMHSFIA